LGRVTDRNQKFCIGGIICYLARGTVIESRRQKEWEISRGIFWHSVFGCVKVVDGKLTWRGYSACKETIFEMRRKMSKSKKLTTAAGIPVPDNQTSLTAGKRGPTLLQDHYLLEKLAHFNRERIPERVVHAKAAGAHGTLTVTQDITRYIKAKLFSEVGKKTEVFGRFSTVAGEKGSEGNPAEDDCPFPQGG
jgi:hypothetical protein